MDIRKVKKLIELLEESNIGEIEIKEMMEKSENLGMKTFDKALFDLFQEGKISEEEALKNADSANNLRLRIKLAGDGGDVGANAGGLSLEDK